MVCLVGSRRGLYQICESHSVTIAAMLARKHGLAISPVRTVPETAPMTATGTSIPSSGLSIKNLRKQFDGFVALDDVSLDVRSGELMTLLGPSGSGKSTLLSIIAGFTSADGGRIMLGQRDMTNLPINKRGLGMVFQNYALFPHMSVGENIAFPLRVRRWSEDRIRARIDETLRLVQLEGFAARRIAGLSGGQKQRVAIARAVVFGPGLVLMDEPLSALDKNLREQMQIEIRRLHTQVGATTIYVTHDQREALTMSDRITVLNKGRIIQCGTPREIYETPNSAFVASFIGETTLLPVRACKDGVILQDGTSIRTACSAEKMTSPMLALRAEKLRLPDESEAGFGQLSATVQEVVYQGDSVLVLVTLSGKESLSIRRPLRSGSGAIKLPVAGERIKVGIASHDAIVVPA